MLHRTRALLKIKVLELLEIILFGYLVIMSMIFNLIMKISGHHLEKILKLYQSYFIARLTTVLTKKRYVLRSAIL